MNWVELAAQIYVIKNVVILGLVALVVLAMVYDFFKNWSK